MASTSQETQALAHQVVASVPARFHKRRAEHLVAEVQRRCSPSSSPTPRSTGKRKRLALTSDAWDWHQANVASELRDLKRPAFSASPMLLDEHDPTLGTIVTQPMPPASMKRSMQRLVGALDVQLEDPETQPCDCKNTPSRWRQDWQAGHVVCEGCGVVSPDPVFDSRPPPSTAQTHAHSASAYADVTDYELTRSGTRAVLGDEAMATQFAVINARMVAFGLAHPVLSNTPRITSQSTWRPALAGTHAKRTNSSQLSTKAQSRVLESMARRIARSNPAPKYSQQAAMSTGLPVQVRKRAQQLLRPTIHTKKRLSVQSKTRNLSAGVLELEAMADHFAIPASLLQHAQKLWRRCVATSRSVLQRWLMSTCVCRFCEHLYQLNLRHYNRSRVSVPALMLYVTEVHGHPLMLQQVATRYGHTKAEYLAQMLRYRSELELPDSTLDMRLWACVQAMAKFLYVQLRSMPVARVCMT